MIVVVGVMRRVCIVLAAFAPGNEYLQLIQQSVFVHAAGGHKLLLSS
jgi:hypothetical protein